jgi:rhodanese-related sulfurtransferase
VFSGQAVEFLRAKGFQAVRLDEGILDWRARGLRVAIGEQP